MGRDIMTRAFFLALSLWVAVVCGKAAARPICDAGRIEEVSSNFSPLLADLYILRTDGNKVKPHALVTLLCPGDQIVIIDANIKVKYSLVGSEDLYAATNGSNPNKVPDNREGSLPPCNAGCTRTPKVRGGPRPVIVISTNAKGQGDRALAASPFLPASVQRLPRREPDVAVIWTGDAASLIVNGLAIEPGGRAFAIFPRPNTAAFDVRLADRFGNGFSWRVSVVDEPPPSPPELGPDSILSGEARIERALWLLDPASGHPDWRMFALSELAALRPSSITADLAWRQVMAGTYNPGADDEVHD